MKRSEVTGKAVHSCGTKRIDRRAKTSPFWEYQMLVVMDMEDPEPEWIPVSADEIEHWPEDGWY